MSHKEFLHEVEIVGLDDDQVKDLIGYSYRAIRTLEDTKKADVRIQELQAALKDYIESEYGIEIKKYKARLKAAVNQANVRGLRYEIPGELK